MACAILSVMAAVLTDGCAADARPVLHSACVVRGGRPAKDGSENNGVDVRKGGCLPPRVRPAGIVKRAPRLHRQCGHRQLLQVRGFELERAAAHRRTERFHQKLHHALFRSAFRAKRGQVRSPRTWRSSHQSGSALQDCIQRAAHRFRWRNERGRDMPRHEVRRSMYLKRGVAAPSRCASAFVRTADSSGARLPPSAFVQRRLRG